MKRKVIYFIIAILLFLWCSGWSNHHLQQSRTKSETVISSTKSIDDLDNKPNQDEGAEWKAYRSILSGDFTLIQDSDYKSEMEYLYKADTQNGKCGWKFILMDFNKDGVNDLFIQLDSEHNSAFFSYAVGKVQCIGIDDLEATCYLQPLKGGKLLETYDYWIAPTKSVYEIDSEFMPVNLIQYISMTVDDYKDFKENYGTIMDEFPTIKKEGVYYFQEINGKKTSLSVEKWKQIQKDIEGQLIPDNEWKYCSELSKS